MIYKFVKSVKDHFYRSMYRNGMHVHVCI